MARAVPQFHPSEPRITSEVRPSAFHSCHSLVVDRTVVKGVLRAILLTYVRLLMKLGLHVSMYIYVDLNRNFCTLNF